METDVPVRWSWMTAQEIAQELVDSMDSTPKEKAIGEILRVAEAHIAVRYREKFRDHDMY